MCDGSRRTGNSARGKVHRAGRKGIFDYQPTINEENKLRREREQESRALYIQGGWSGDQPKRDMADHGQRRDNNML